MKLKKTDINHIIKKAITTSLNSSMFDVREILLRHNLKRLVIIDSENKPVGIITEKDIVKTIYAIGDRPIKSVKVSGFMSKKLVTIKNTNTVYDCAKLMEKNRISSVVVVDKNGILEGLITKTDLASVFLTHAIVPLKVASIMTKKVVTAMPNDSLLYVESLLLHNKIARIVVQRNRIPIGVITFRDFVPAKLPYWIAQNAEPSEVQKYKMKSNIDNFHVNQMNHLLYFKAVDIMSSNPITIEENEDVGAAVLLMIRNNISGIPVVKKSKLVGVVTKTDIVRAIAKA